MNQEVRQQELEQRKNVLSKTDLEDYLTEDPQIQAQNYFVFSYLLPDKSKNDIKFPIFKVRGSYKTIEECEKRVNKLKTLDQYFNMYVCEVGKFGYLVNEEELSKNDSIDIQYRETALNNMVKEYRENKDKSDEEFQTRKDNLLKKAAKDNSAKGKEKLENKKEHPSVLQDRINVLSKHLEEYAERIAECKEIIQLSKKQLDDYTPEEIEKFEKDFVEENKDFLAINKK